jgi:hypothetical protein
MTALRKSAAAIVLSVFLCGCSHSLSTLQENAATGTVTAIAVGDVVDDSPDHRREVRRFRRQLVLNLRESDAFDRVLSPRPATLPADAVVLTGHIHRIGDGSEAMRFAVGYGAGAPRLRARFEIHDPAGVRLAAFSQTARSFDGTGYAAHWNPAYLDELVDDLAERTADAVVRWHHGEPLQPGFLNWDDLDVGLFEWDLLDVRTWKLLP